LLFFSFSVINVSVEFIIFIHDDKRNRMAAALQIRKAADKEKIAH